MTDVTVKHEPRTYEAHSRHSFFKDVAAWVAQRDDNAGARLARHEHEMRVDSGEQRAAPNSTLGTGGEFTPPGWLVDKFATAARAGRPLADLVNRLPLPRGVHEVDIPRITTGHQVANQTVDGGVVAGVDVVTATATSPVVTIAGQGDVSQQLIDQSAAPGYDAVAFLDLNLDYNRKIEQQVLNGSGTNGQLLGVKNVTGITTVNGATVGASQAAAEIAKLWAFMGQAAAGVGNTRFLEPNVWLLAPRRWFWLASGVDSSSRPINSPSNIGPRTSDEWQPAGGTVPIARVHGMPAYTDGAITSTATDNDFVVACRPSDMFLWESEPKVLAAVNTLAETLQVRLSLHRYVAFVGNRYPSGIGVVTNLVQPTNF